ncbi:histidinol dehydrogenase [Bacillus sp. ISL-75]|uniref:histidinol dehydrogenase n=1 Tax=Bacillus sp. ISL-75 TaxID=2819137 RepID=UPI001BEB707F|nr:histidinol dehydrogenase [Bacillus sp. ISL-75]MBT2728626.1 histidinol dehydrogenase [Bacillus sp. ISL-75]
MEYLKKAKLYEQTYSNDVEQTVKEIIEVVRSEGDAGVKEYEKRFSQSDRPLRVSDEEIERCISKLSDEVKELIDRVVDRVSAFSQAQLECLMPFEREFGPGIHMGHRIIPIEKVGAYVPGGRFPLLSSGPMVVAPAKVAGAKQIVACSPANFNGGIHPAVLYGLVKSGATDIFAIGGAQAIAAMAYGTESVPEVDIIAGPGNRFVAEAKRQVFGKVGIDLIAGPSEIMVFADDSANPKKCAADLLAQAEHDPFARAIFVTTSRNLAKQTVDEIEHLLQEFSPSSPAYESWSNLGEIIYAESLQEGIDICNDYAIEHLHLHVRDSRLLMEQLHNYGSLFIDSDSSVVFSDKVSGTNHTLPTNRAARYTGGLWVGSYVKVITHQQITGDGVQYLASHAAKQSDIEGLEGHRLSAAIRLTEDEVPTAK